MPRIRRSRRKKRSPSSLGSKATSRSRVGSLGSKAKPRSSTIRRSGGSTSQPFRRQTYRIRRPRYRRPVGYTYPRRYRARPCSSGGCLTVIIFLAIFWLIYLAPTITLNLDATLQFILPIAVVIVLFIIALGFIANIMDDDDDDSGGSSSDEVRVIERERVLVVCPYCGAKNEQGVTTCKNCDAEI